MTFDTEAFESGAIAADAEALAELHGGTVLAEVLVAAPEPDVLEP